MFPTDLNRFDGMVARFVLELCTALGGDPKTSKRLGLERTVADERGMVRGLPGGRMAGIWNAGRVLREVPSAENHADVGFSTRSSIISTASHDRSGGARSVLSSVIERGNDGRKTRVRSDREQCSASRRWQGTNIADARRRTPCPLPRDPRTLIAWCRRGRLDDRERAAGLPPLTPVEVSVTWMVQGARMRDQHPTKQRCEDYTQNWSMS
jgi:hypothetical protein